MKHIVLALLAAATILSCNRSSGDAQRVVAFQDTLTSQDSASVRQLIDDFFAVMMRGDYYDAAATLYSINPDVPHAEPMPLGNKSMDRVVAVFRSIPFTGYAIDYIKFSEETENEVRCSLIISTSPDARPLVSHFTFTPVRYLGYWVLCVPDFESGAAAIASSDDRASHAMSSED